MKRWNMVSLGFVTVALLFTVCCLLGMIGFIIVDDMDNADKCIYILHTSSLFWIGVCCGYGIHPILYEKD